MKTMRKEEGEQSWQWVLGIGGLEFDAIRQMLREPCCWCGDAQEGQQLLTAACR